MNTDKLNTAGWHKSPWQKRRRLGRGFRPASKPPRSRICCFLIGLEKYQVDRFGISWTSIVMSRLLGIFESHTARSGTCMVASLIPACCPRGSPPRLGLFPKSCSRVRPIDHTIQNLRRSSCRVSSFEYSAIVNLQERELKMGFLINKPAD